MAAETLDEVESLLRRGLDFYGKDFFSEAEICWRRALLLAPGERRAVEYLEAMGVDPTAPLMDEPLSSPPGEVAVSRTPVPPASSPPGMVSPLLPPPSSSGPQVSPLPPTVSSLPPISSLPVAGLRILVADGNETQIRLAGTLFRGAEVMGATSLRAAVEIGRATRPDLAFLSCMLPGGGGVRAIEALRLSPTPVTTRFILTATPTEAPLVRTRLGALGASLYLKPFARDSLLRLLAEVPPGAR